MAGFDEIYYLGSPGGYMGADGLNTIDLEILVGSSDRKWFEARYFTPNLRPMAGIKVVIADTPEPHEALLQALIILATDLFSECQSLDRIRDAVDRIDRERLKGEDWTNLLNEARPIFKKLALYRARLESIHESRRGGLEV